MTIGYQTVIWYITLPDAYHTIFGRSRTVLETLCVVKLLQHASVIIQ